MLRANIQKRSMKVLLPDWLNNSKNNLAVIFNRSGDISGYNELFAATLVNIDLHNISEYFSEDETIELWNTIGSFAAHDNAPKSFLACASDQSVYQWEIAPFDEEHIIGIAQKQDISVNNRFTQINIHHLVDSFMNNTPASAWICDETGRVITMNKYYLSFGGFSTGEIGKTVWEMFPKELADNYFRNNCIVIQNNQVLKTEEISIDKSGQQRHFLVYKFPLKTIQGKKLVGGWAVDITDHKAAEQKITAHNHKIKELTFLQSHEVRRPLANMLGLMELIKQDINNISDEKIKNTLHYIQKSAIELDIELRKVIDKLIE